MRIRPKKSGPTPRMRASQQMADQSYDKKFTYRAQRAEDENNTGRNAQAEKPVKKRGNGRSWLQKLGLLILMVAVIASAVNILTLTNQPKIITLNDNKSNDFLSETSEYESAVKSILSKSLLNRSKITIDTKSISEQMSSEYPELASVSVTVPLLAHRPIVYIEPAKPVLIITTVNGSFVVADSGKAIQQIDNTALIPAYKLPVINDESGVKLQVGKEAIAPDHVSFIDTIVKQLNNRKFSITNMKLPPASSELDVSIAGQAYVIKFNLQDNTPRQQAGTFISTVEYLQKMNQPQPAKYIDVRVNGRAYYQ